MLEREDTAIRYFGTDGIRWLIKTDPQCHLAFALGNALCKHLPRPTVCLGRDTRPSGLCIGLSLAAGVVAGGGNVVDYGVLPTPALAYLTKRQGTFGAMISASHNPADYNGIKLCNASGEKPTPDTLLCIEEDISTPTLYLPGGSYQSATADEYLDLFEAFLPDLSNRRIVLDCANGATVEFAPKLFTLTNATVLPIFTDPTQPINQDCGATHPKTLRRAVLENNADFGFAFDGDGDRVIACGRSGRIYDGNDFLYLIGKRWKPDGVVGTVLTNRAVERALLQQGTTLHRADVGDYNVLNLCKQCGCTVGAEPSGHILFRSILPSSDGILSALTVSPWIETYDASPLGLDLQITQNIPKNGQESRILALLSQLIGSFEAKYNCRIIARESGTEPLLRITVEGADEYSVQTAIEQTRRTIERLCSEQ